MWKGSLETQPWYVVYKGWTRKQHDRHDELARCPDSPRGFLRMSPQVSLTSPFISFTFYTSMGWNAENNLSISLIFLRENLKAILLWSVQTCTQQNIALSDFSGYKMLDICAFHWFLIHLPVCRIPLIKGKTAREALKEKGLWDEYRKRYPYNPVAKFMQSGTESMSNDADVSPDQRQFRVGSSYCLSWVTSVCCLCTYILCYCSIWNTNMFYALDQVVVFSCPSSCPTLVWSPLVTHLSPSVSSLTPAPPTCGSLQSTAPARPAVTITDYHCIPWCFSGSQLYSGSNYL